MLVITQVVAEEQKPQIGGISEIPETVTLTQEQIMFLNQSADQLQQNLNDQRGLVVFWFRKYEELKACVDTATREGFSPRICLGDNES